MEGYEILPQRGDRESQYIKKCQEEVSIEINIPDPAPGILEIGKVRGEILSKDFIFGLVNTNHDKVLDIPLIVCLVEQKDWIPV